MTLQQTICWLKIQEDFFKKKCFFQLSDKSGPRSYGFLLLFLYIPFPASSSKLSGFLESCSISAVPRIFSGSSS